MARLVRTLLLAAVLLGPGGRTAFAADQPRYRVGETSTSFTDLTGETIPAIVFYPSAQANGRSIPLDTRFPGVVFLQGANIIAARYTWLSGLAAYGYIVMIPDKPGIAHPSTSDPTVMVNEILTNVDILDKAVKRLKTWTYEPASPIYSRLEPHIAASGHSAGAYVSMVGISPNGCLDHPADEVFSCPPGYHPDPAVQAMISIAGTHNNTLDPQPTTPMLKPTPAFPVYLIAGQNDGVNTPAQVKATYARYSGTKFYAEIAGANHYGWTDYTVPGDTSGPDHPAMIAPDQQQDLTVMTMAAFLDCTFKNRQSACGGMALSPAA